VELSRHAKNKLRALRMTPLDADWVVSNPIAIDSDADGRPRYLGEVRDTQIFVVVALDEPDLIVTIYRRGRG
jgi:hypothetical protein